MEKELEQQIQARLAELPEAVRAAMQPAVLGPKVQALAAAHKLHLDQVTSLETNILLVMLGFSEPADFVADIAKDLSLSDEEAQKVGDEVATAVFVPVRQAMQEFFEEKETSELAAQVIALEKPTIPEKVGIPLAAHPVVPTGTDPLSEKTTTATPAPYKNDPYREPAV